MTRLLNTPDIGRLTAWVDSSSGDILAGLSKCPIRKMPPGFWANAALADANPTRSEPAAASTRGPFFISEYLLFKEAGLKCPPFPARLPDRRFFDQLPAGRATAVAAATGAGLPSALSISPIERRLVSKPMNQRANAPKTYQNAK